MLFTKTHYCETYVVTKGLFMNILFGVSYVGTNYAGWQRQDNALGIQEVIENALQQITGKYVEIFASGRTDAGVHAYEQCFNAQLDFKDVKKLPRALNAFLPEDIKITYAKEVAGDFHARYSAHKKTYVYRLKQGDTQSPFDSFYTAYTQYNLDHKKMQKAADMFVGTHNFHAFCSSGTTVKDFERTIYSFTVTKTQNLYEFEICGNGFLYNMVRIIVGTLVDIARGKIAIDKIEEMFKTGKRQLAGKTMDAKGLVLKKVEY